MPEIDIILFLSISVPAILLLLLLTFARLVRSGPGFIDLKLRIYLVVQYVAFAIIIFLVLRETRILNWQMEPLGGYTFQREFWEVETGRLMRDLLSQPKYQDPRQLIHFEAKVYSQNGEDGMIAEIFRRIGETNHYFVEFGSADGMENNTVLLLQQGWSGLWMDGDEDSITRAKEHFVSEIDVQRLTAKAEFITAENIEQLFADSNVPTEFDLLSIDIDHNDYHVWKAIELYQPRVVVIEYNAIFPPGHDWVVKYRPNAVWDGSSKFGASLTALTRLGEAKGYSLVACCTAGVNAFFVQKDLVDDQFCGPSTAEFHYEPARYWTRFGWGGHPRLP